MVPVRAIPFRILVVSLLAASAIVVSGRAEDELSVSFKVLADVPVDAGVDEAARSRSGAAFGDKDAFLKSAAQGRDSVYWLWLDLSALADDVLAPLLFVGRPLPEVVELFVVQSDGTVASEASGSHVPWGAHSVVRRRGELMLPKGWEAEQGAFMRLQISEPIDPGKWRVRYGVPAKTWSARFSFMDGYLQGAVISVGFYYLLLFIGVRERIYGWLAFYVIGLACYNLVQGGDIRFIWREGVSWQSHWYLQQFFIVINCLGAIEFGRSFLNIPQRLPRWNRVLTGLQAINLSSFPLLAWSINVGWNPHSFEQYHTLFLLVTMVVQIGLTLTCALRGQRSAWFYFASYAVLCLGIWSEFFLNYWKVLSVEADSLWAPLFEMLSRHGYGWGILVEVLLMAFAVATLIREYRREGEKATQAAMASALETAQLKENYASDLERDLAERTAEVRENNAQLERRDTLKSRFFANLSHEFRTPLSLIKSPAEDLAKGRHGDLDETGKRKLRTLLGQSAHLEDLIDQMLELSRLDAGKLKLRVAQHDLTAFLDATTGNFNSLAAQRGISLKFNSRPVRMMLWFDEEMLKKVINNLLSNALKFTPAGGTVTVTIESSSPDSNASGVDNFAAVVVSDTGSGIAADAVGRVFERFFQVEEDSMKHQRGSGIGLALAKELVELHGGLIAAESKVGEGTSIRFTLPEGRDHFQDEEIIVVQKRPTESDSAESGTAAKSKAPPSAASADQPTVLVVEDHPELRSYLCEQLTDGFTVLQAIDGEEALTLARREQPDIILSDVMMPRRDGLSLLREIRNDPGLQSTPVILLTARGDEDDKLRGLTARADDYLTKPFNVDELRLRMENLLRSRSLLLETQPTPVAPLVVADLDVSSADAKFLEQLEALTEARYTDVGFRLDELARGLKLSDSSLRRKIRDLLGLTPALYLRQFRIERARQLVAARSHGTMAEIAQAVGFGSPGYFARLYEKVTGENIAQLLRESR